MDESYNPPGDTGMPSPSNGPPGMEGSYNPPGSGMPAEMGMGSGSGSGIPNGMSGASGYPSTNGMGMAMPGSGNMGAMGAMGMGMPWVWVAWAWCGMGMAGQFAPPEDPAPAEDDDYLTKGRYAFSIGKEKEAIEYALASSLSQRPRELMYFKRPNGLQRVCAPLQ